MSYQLGIDFGTTSTAAVVRRAEGTGDTEVVPLGGRGGAVPSVLHLARDGRRDRRRGRRESRRDRPDARRARPQASGGRPGAGRARRPAVDGRGAVGPAGALGGRPRRREGGRAARRDRPGTPGVVGAAHARAARLRPRRRRIWASRSSPSRSAVAHAALAVRRAGRHGRGPRLRGRPVRRGRAAPGRDARWRLRGARRPRGDRRPRRPRPRRAGVAARPEVAARRRDAGRAGPARVHPREGDAELRERGRGADPVRRVPRRRPARSDDVRAS